MPDAVIAADALSATILRDLFEAGLAANLTDPKAAKRSLAKDACRLVMTSFPDRNAFYPVVVVSEANNNLDRIDQRGDLQAGDYDVAVTIYSETATDLAKLRDGVKAWVLRNQRALQSAGFVEARLTSSTDANYDSTSDVLAWKLVYRGLVHAI